MDFMHERMPFLYMATSKIKMSKMRIIQFRGPIDSNSIIEQLVNLRLEGSVHTACKIVSSTILACLAL